MLSKWFMVVAGLAGCSGVALGALTAHALRARLDAGALATLDTVSKYLLIHAALLLVIALWTRSAADTGILKVAGALVLAGMIFFCGGLTVSVLSGVRQFAGAAPAGGMAFMAAWLACALYAVLKL